MAVKFIRLHPKNRVLAWLDRGVVKSIRYRGQAYKVALALFALSFVLLGVVGSGLSAAWIPRIFGPGVEVGAIDNAFGRSWMLVYFGFFAFLWIYTHFGFERTKRVPTRIAFDD